MSHRRKSRGPGRPSNEHSPEARRRLLDAARELCIETGVDAASTKRIAARAGVNPAMIHYYFGGKEALCRAMMHDAISPLLERLDAAAQAGPLNVTIEDFMRAYLQALAANPWLPRLVIREVLPVNGRFRDIFLDELVARAVKLVPAMLKHAQQAGRLRGDVDPRLIMLSLVSLAVFPFLAAPIVEHALQVDLRDEAFIGELIEHSIGVFNRGLSARETS